jgi:hypothetical protein
MLGALSHGLPQLALPHGADQFTNAQALVHSGAARQDVLSRGEADDGRIVLEILVPGLEHGAVDLAHGVGGRAVLGT